MLPVAVDAMGGDRAPGDIVAGAYRAATQLGVPVVLVGQPDAIASVELEAPDGPGGLSLAVIPASECIGMSEDPATGVRRKKDSSLVRAAEAVRDGRASAMVSAGNTGATMASALLRMGRLKGVQRPAIATPIPVPGGRPTVLLDAGANAECTPAHLVQFALMGSVFAAHRFGVAAPRVGLLSIGEEDTKGTPLVRETNVALRSTPGLTFVGNVEGRDLMSDEVDVVVTDGFTGNVALKTLEGGLRFIVAAVLGALDSTEQAREAAKVLIPALAPLADELDPEATGGAMLLGVDGVCVISHGSSGPRAILNAIRVAAEMVGADVVAHLAAAIGSGATPR